MSLKLYLISFELQPGRSYPSVRSHLLELQAEQILGQQWAVRTIFTAAQLRDRFRRFLDEADRITVVEVGEERASRRAMADLKGL